MFEFKTSFNTNNTLHEAIAQGLYTLKQLNYDLFLDVHKDLINSWDEVMQRAKKITNYQPHYLYSLSQINKELNNKIVKYIDVFGKPQYGYEDDGLLNSSIQILKNKLKLFYSEYIEPKLFEYEIIK